MECTDKRLLLPVALDSRLKDRVAVLRILERDALYGTLNFLHDGLLLTIIHVRLPRLSDVLCIGLSKEHRLTVILEG